ncbi:MAG: hypothetical protein PF637_10260 [Spirochaetes bacterium]|jgi:hypothetical protein|nr:hypothetical protein [Spirochaetota bacterium]
MVFVIISASILLGAYFAFTIQRKENNEFSENDEIVINAINSLNRLTDSKIDKFILKIKNEDSTQNDITGLKAGAYWPHHLRENIDFISEYDSIKRKQSLFQVESKMNLLDSNPTYYPKSSYKVERKYQKESKSYRKMRQHAKAICLYN